MCGSDDIHGAHFKAKPKCPMLLCAGDVMDALGSKKSDVPYRNSKLTHVLQNALGVGVGVGQGGGGAWDEPRAG